MLNMSSLHWDKNYFWRKPMAVHDLLTLILTGSCVFDKHFAFGANGYDEQYGPPRKPVDADTRTGGWFRNVDEVQYDQVIACCLTENLLFGHEAHDDDDDFSSEVSGLTIEEVGTVSTFSEDAYAPEEFEHLPLVSGKTRRKVRPPAKARLRVHPSPMQSLPCFIRKRLVEIVDARCRQVVFMTTNAYVV